VRKQSKPEDVADVFKEDMSFLKLLHEKAEALTEHSFYSYWFPQKIQVDIELLLSQKRGHKDVAGMLALIMFAGINFDKEELFQSGIIEKTFEDDEFRECLQNLSSLLFGITVDDVRNTLFTFLKFEILFCLVRQQGSRFLEKVRECCTNKKSLLNVALKINSQKANPMTLKMLRLVAIEGLYSMSMIK
jgi:hypothetical protein